MKVRVLSIFTAGAMLLGVAALMAPAASASRAPSASHGTKGIAPHAVDQTSKLCNTTADPNVDSVASQNFEKKFDAYDAYGAQSCTLKSKKAKITGILVPGTYFNGSGPAVSETVTFYADAAGIPGASLNSQTVTGTDAAGSFTIALTPLTITKAGNPTFWVSVQVNMDFKVGGQWGWDTTSTAHGLADQWINPGGGYNLGTAYQPVGNLDSGLSVSFQSALQGKGTGN